MRVLVFAEKEASLIKLCQSVHGLGDQVEAISLTQAAFVKGAEKVWHLPVKEGLRLEDYVPSLVAFFAAEQPDWIVFEPTKRCKCVAAMVAASLKISVLTDVLDIKNGIAERMVFGGLAIQKEKVAGKISMVMLGSGVFAEQDLPAGAATGVIAFVEPAHSLKVVRTEHLQGSKADLGSAKKIIGVGRGIGKAEDLQMIQSLATGIGAEVGCSRPIAESEGWMPKETYIGVSGLILSPEVYLAVGISGQVQHMVGINRAKTVIAVNKDKNAPVFKQADYGIVGDLYKVLPALVDKFAK